MPNQNTLFFFPLLHARKEEEERTLLCWNGSKVKFQAKVPGEEREKKRERERLGSTGKFMAKREENV